MISEEPTTEVTLIDIKCKFVLMVYVTRLYTFHPLCRDLRIFLRDRDRDPQNVLRNI